MQWYVLQTRTGEEEKLVDLVHKLVPDYLYGACFVVRQEQLWRRRQQNLIHWFWFCFLRQGFFV